MSSRSSKRNSSSHSSSDDSPAHVTVNPKQEELIDEEAKNAYYRALVGSAPPLLDVPVPKRPSRLSGASFTSRSVSLKYLRTLRDCCAYPW
ncbi:hypothetical protein Bca4012_026718 [Brassica carinata]